MPWLFPPPQVLNNYQSWLARVLSLLQGLSQTLQPCEVRSDGQWLRCLCLIVWPALTLYMCLLSMLDLHRKNEGKWFCCAKICNNVPAQGQNQESSLFIRAPTKSARYVVHVIESREIVLSAHNQKIARLTMAAPDVGQHGPSSAPEPKDGLSFLERDDDSTIVSKEIVPTNKV